MMVMLKASFYIQLLLHPKFVLMDSLRRDCELYQCGSSHRLNYISDHISCSHLHPLIIYQPQAPIPDNPAIYEWD